jgi:hypothetical protein
LPNHAVFHLRHGRDPGYARILAEHRYLPVQIGANRELNAAVLKDLPNA